jgi:hypothetical protein
LKHLSTEELLLIADGELPANGVGHLGDCVECQSSLGALQGELTAISSALTAPASGDPGSEQSWSRLEAAISRVSQTQDLHLAPEELLLLIDGDLTPGRAEHAKRCVGCGSAQVEVRHLLWNIESELRAMAPSESLERRMAAEQALKLHLYASKPKVVVFPVRGIARYAAAAAALISVVAGGWLWNLSPVDAPQAVIAEAVPMEAPVFTAVVAPDEPVLEPPSFLAPLVVIGEVEAATAPLPPARFNFVSERLIMMPGAQVIATALPTLRLLPVSQATFGFASLPTVAQPLIETQETFEALPSEAYLAVLEARRWQLETGLWREDVRPTWRDGRLAFAGSVESDSARQRYVTAIEQQADGRTVGFDLSIRPVADSQHGQLNQESPTAVGGLVRTALMEHYRDAARRSFQSTETSGLESEIARYVSDIFRSQNDLVGHAYQLDQLLNHSPESRVAGNSAAKTLVAGLIRFHVEGMGRGEAAIYDSLSEALPRRYWRYQGERDESLASSDGLCEESSGLLQDVLGLERTLIVVLTGSQQTVAFAEVGTSSGELLHRIHDRLDRIKDLTRSAL